MSETTPAPLLIDGQPVAPTPEQVASLAASAAPPVPLSVSNFQARAVLRSRYLPDGRSMLTAVTETLGAARAATAGLPESDPERIAADLGWQAWEQSNVVERDSAIVQQFATMFALDEAALDALFTAAAGVTA